jgi:hypothetical protein
MAKSNSGASLEKFSKVMEHDSRKTTEKPEPPSAVAFCKRVSVTNLQGAFPKEAGLRTLSPKRPTG